MNNIAIRVDNLGKRYNLAAAQDRNDTLRDAFMGLFGRLRQQSKAMTKNPPFWALKDVSFDVKPGEVVGIIGQNGAGKSTLLKVLSRITEPTLGEVEVYGRIGSLLEVGTGFHPELSGRENVYMSGALLGMRRAEIEHKFDEIVAFSGVEKFIDMPIKRYSSGMNVRLGFAVAAHLEPEILLVDEVLAVGDAAFQRRCLGKMEDVAKEGRTVLFVSHNMIALQSLCQRAIWLHQGQVRESGPTAPVVANYLKQTTDSANLTHQIWLDSAVAPGNDMVHLHSVRIETMDDSPLITMQTPLQVTIEYWNHVPGMQLHTTLHVLTEQGIVAFSTFPTLDPTQEIATGLYRATCQIPGDLLNSGTHVVNLLIVKERSSTAYRHDRALVFEVVDTNVRDGAWYGREPGALHPVLPWSTELVQGQVVNIE